MLHENASPIESQESLRNKSPEVEKINYNQPLEFQVESLINDVPNIQDNLDSLYGQLDGSYEDLSPQTRSHIEQFKKRAGKLARNTLLAMTLSIPSPAYGNQEFLHPHETMTDESVTLQEMGVREREEQRPYRFLSKESITDPSMHRLVEKASEGITANFVEELKEEFKDLSSESKNEYIFYITENTAGKWEFVPMANLKNAVNEIEGQQLTIGGGYTVPPITYPELIAQDDLKRIHVMHNHNKHDVDHFRSKIIEDGGYETVDSDALDFPPSIIDIGDHSLQMNAYGLSSNFELDCKVTTTDGVWTYSKNKSTVYDDIQNSILSIAPENREIIAGYLLGNLPEEEIEGTNEETRSFIQVFQSQQDSINSLQKNYMSAKGDLIFGEGDQEKLIEKTVGAAKQLGFDLEYKPY